MYVLVLQAAGFGQRVWELWLPAPACSSRSHLLQLHLPRPAAVAVVSFTAIHQSINERRGEPNETSENILFAGAGLLRHGAFAQAASPPHRQHHLRRHRNIVCTPAPPTISAVVDREISIIEKEFVDAAEAMRKTNTISRPRLNIQGSDYKAFVRLPRSKARGHATICSGRISGDPMLPGTNGPMAPTTIKTKAEIVKYLKDSYAIATRPRMLTARILWTVKIMMSPNRCQAVCRHLWGGPRIRPLRTSGGILAHNGISRR